MSEKITLSHLRLFAVLIFTLTTLSPVFAGDVYNGVRILVGVVPEKQGMETKIDILIYNLLVFEFERYGLIIEKINFEPNDSLELILSSDSGTGLAVICSYTTIDTRVLLDIELYDSRTMVLIASASTGADLDLAFDKVIFSAVSELISEADEELKKRVVNMDYEDLSEDTETVIEEDITEEVTESEVSVSDSDSAGKLELSLHGGTSLGVGRSNEVFQKPGMYAGLSLNYWFNTAIGLVGLGAQASANIYNYAGPTGQAGLMMFPMGIILAYSTPSEKLFSFLFQIGSGPAVAMLLFDDAEALIKVLPYLGGEVALNFNFRNRMSLGLRTAYTIYFEEAGMLTTVTPSAYVSFRS